jgi:cyclopropane fatty-acyl-phospholipid synthase-like methyltransferase
MENNNTYWYRDAVGGLWEEMGKLQFEFLVEKGLSPQDFLLDIGCGSLRGGIHFIQYLEHRHYFGIDKSKELLDAGMIEIQNNNLIHKNPTLVQMENFEFQNLNQKFDYTLAQSVFTHLTLNDIIKCLMNVEKVINQGGKFYSTFFENKKGKFYLEALVHPRSDGPDLTTYFNQDPYHYDFETFEWICEGTSLKVKYIGDWNHPRDQKVMVFTKV